MATFQTPWWRIALRGWICSSRHAAPRFAYPPIGGGCLLLPWRHPWPTLPKSFFPSFISTLGLVTTFSTILSLSLSPSDILISFLRSYRSCLPSHPIPSFISSCLSSYTRVYDITNSNSRKSREKEEGEKEMFKFFCAATHDFSFQFTSLTQLSTLQTYSTVSSIDTLTFDTTTRGSMRAIRPRTLVFAYDKGADDTRTIVTSHTYSITVVSFFCSTLSRWNQFNLNRNNLMLCEISSDTMSWKLLH